MKILIWNEYHDECNRTAVAAVYPKGIHVVLRAALEPLGHSCTVTTLADVLLGQDKIYQDLATADVIVWWSHRLWLSVPEDYAGLVVNKVLNGTGLLALHSAYLSKPFKTLLGAPLCFKWREAGEWSRLWLTEPGHPISSGLPECIYLPQEEMYGEPSGMPQPEATLAIASYEHGEVFRACNVWRRGNGKIAYLASGHETYPVYYNPDIQHLLRNLVTWLAPTVPAQFSYGEVKH